jgi:two-component system phosphate regulon response regulator OmpR
MNEPAHILVVDDDDRIRTLLKRFLAGKGYQVTGAPDAAVARRLMDAVEFDLLVLDVMMPGEDGFSLTQALRRERDVPILLLTARGAPEDRIEGLRRGADDYLPKPFEPEELALRVASILRRAPAPAAPSMLRLGEAMYDPGRKRLSRAGAEIRLTEAEGSLLEVLASRPGAVFTREELARRCALGMERSVDVQVTRLRRKLEADPADPRYVLTVRGAGYRLAPESAGG